MNDSIFENTSLTLAKAIDKLGELYISLINSEDRIMVDLIICIR